MCTFPDCAWCGRTWTDHYPEPADCPGYDRPRRFRALTDTVWALWWLAWDLIRR